MGRDSLDAMTDATENHELSQEQVDALRHGVPVIITRPGEERLELTGPAHKE